MTAAQVPTARVDFKAAALAAVCGKQGRLLFALSKTVTAAVATTSVIARMRGLPAGLAV